MGALQKRKRPTSNLRDAGQVGRQESLDKQETGETGHDDTTHRYCKLAELADAVFATRALPPSRFLGPALYHVVNSVIAAYNWAADSKPRLLGKRLHRRFGGQ